MESQARTTITRFADNFVSIVDPRASRRKNKIFHSLACEFQTSYITELWGGGKRITIFPAIEVYASFQKTSAIGVAKNAAFDALLSL